MLWSGTSLVRQFLMQALVVDATVYPAATRTLKEGWDFDHSSNEPRNPVDPTAGNGWDVVTPDAVTIQANLRRLSPHDWRLQRLGLTEGEIIEFFCDYSHWDLLETCERLVVDGYDYDVPKNHDSICEMRKERDTNGVVVRIRVLTRLVVRPSDG